MGHDMIDRKRITVTDRAIVRYLEEIAGFDIHGLRTSLAQAASVGVAHGARVVVISGGKLLLSGDTVMSAIGRQDVVHPQVGEIEALDAIFLRRIPKRRRR